MSLDPSLNIYFVTATSGNSNVDRTKSKDFELAKKCMCKLFDEEKIRNIKANEGFPLIASGQLTKRDVFLFDHFEGDFFKQLQLTPALIVGPPCIIQCVPTSQPIPHTNSPVFSTGMRNLKVSASGVTAKEKEKLKTLVEWMGGTYFQNFGRPVTHLISNTIKSTKYELATLNGIPVMHVNWVQRVWERSCDTDANVNGADEEFDNYRLPIFFETNITCTGLDVSKKNEIMSLVNENGGTYHRAFRSQLVDIVITEKDKTNSDKYQAAMRYNKEILVPEWIFDSVQKGFALPTKDYHVKSLKVSTPTKTDQSIADFTTTDTSDISRISVAIGKRNIISTTNLSDTMNETHQSGSDGVVPTPTPKPGTSKDMQRELLRKAGATGTHYRLIYDEICPKQAKKAGTFLDGCCVYLSGFRLDEREKLNRILNVGGATRYDVLNEKLTHIIVGQLDDAEFKTWKKDGLLTAVHIVRLDWLLESIKQQTPASEVVYRISLPTIREPDAPSPSSKRTLRSMNRSFKRPEVPIKKKLFDTSATADTPNDRSDDDSAHLAPVATSTELPMEEDDHNLLAQYSEENVVRPAAELPPLAVPPLVDEAPAANKGNDISIDRLQTSSTLHPVLDAPADPKKPQDAVLSENTNTMTTIDYENLDFFRGMALYIDKENFPEEFFSQMISECEAAQGNVVSESFIDTVDYAIVSFERTLDESKLPVSARHVVTELYVESCLKENKIMPIQYFHKPIPHTADSHPLQDMIIVVSLYAGLERDFIESIAQLLGARVNKTFVRKERALLVCPSAEGSKYEGALKWQYPVVTSEWLVQCAIHGEKLSYRPYLVGDSPQEFPQSPPTALKTPARESVASVAEVRHGNGADPSAMDVDIPKEDMTLQPHEDTPKSTTMIKGRDVTDFTPLRNRRVSELAGPMRVSSPESPHTPVNSLTRPSCNFDYLEQIVAEFDDDTERQCAREVIMEMRNNQTPELERIRRQACTPINRKLPTPKGIPDFCTTPAFEKRMADEFERRWQMPTRKFNPTTPIEVVRRRVIRATCRALGVPFSSDEESSTPVFAQKQSLAFGKASKVGGKPGLLAAASLHSPTSPSVLGGRRMTRENTRRDSDPKMIQTTRLSDLYVPATQTPNASPQANQSEGMGHRALLGKTTTINFDKITFEDTSDEAHNTSSANTSAVSMTSEAAASTTSPELKQIREFLNRQSRRQSLKRIEDGQGYGNQHNPVVSSENMADTEAQYVQPFESEQFGPGTEEMVGWRDPVEFSIERRSRSVNGMHYKGTPRFSISCSEDIRDETINRIFHLGGTVSENLVNYDPECTHFLCERPNRGEKMLSCIAAGKWALSLKYVEESFAKGVFVEEQLFEWGNPKAVNLPKLSNEEQKIAQAAHRWRKQLATSSAKDGTDGEVSPSVGAFSGFRVLLEIPDRNLEAVKTVLRAGKGEFVEAKPPYSKTNGYPHLATHCFVDVKKNSLLPADYKFLTENGVQIMSQLYINGYLMNGKDGDFSKFIIKK